MYITREEVESMRTCYICTCVYICICISCQRVVKTWSHLKPWVLPLDLVSCFLTLFHSRERSHWALKHFLNARGFVSKQGSPVSSYATSKQRSFPSNILNNRFCAKRKSPQDWFWTNGKLVGFWMVCCVRKTRFFKKIVDFVLRHSWLTMLLVSSVQQSASVIHRLVAILFPNSFPT